MCVALIGGMDRLERHYVNEVKQFGVKLKVFTKHKTGILSKIKNVDAVVIFTNKVSHNAKKEVVNVAKTEKIPVFMYHSRDLYTAGLSSLFSFERERKRLTQNKSKSIKGGL